MAGHVFVIHGDLTRFLCDAWLMPCDTRAGIEPYWLVNAGPQMLDRLALPPGNRVKSTYLGDLPEGWGKQGVRVLRWEGWSNHQPSRPWMTNMGGSKRTEAAWYIEGVRQFLTACRNEFATSPQRQEGPWRSKPLVAIPLVGTGHGGAWSRKGALIPELLRFLYLELERDDNELDIALIIRDRRAFDAVQAHRRLLCRQMYQSGVEVLWPELSAQQRAKGDRLATYARQGRLALFIGAGVSQGAGLPGWGSLLGNLAERAALSQEEQRAFQQLDYYDRARILEYRLGGHQPLRNAIASALDKRHYALGHGLLASLPTRENVTLNYDALLELAITSTGQRLAVLPYEPASSSDRWILKMHGCIRHQEEIVLTREDYIRYSDRRAALAGLVQGLLITRHMLFVGFSLVDDNFHRIADDVRKALGLDHENPAPQDPFGSALLLEQNPLLEDIWSRDLHLIAMSPAGLDGQGFLNAARLLDIFLDYVCFQASDNISYLLDRTYAGLLTVQEERLRQALLDLELKIHNIAQETSDLQHAPSLARLQEILREFGRNPPKGSL